MRSNLNEFEQERPLRPTLLTVLCILTFVGSAWTIISGVITYSTASQTVKLFSSSGVQKSNDSTLQKDSAMKAGHKNRSVFGEKIMLKVLPMMTEANIRKSAIGTIFSGLCTFLGAVFMWRLRRIGFYIYIAGVVIAMVVPIYLYRNNFVLVGGSFIPEFFGLIFIALYALDIKSLR